LILRLCIAGAALTTLVFAGLELTDRIRGELVLTQDAALTAGEMADEGRWAEAGMVAEFVLSRPDLGDEEKAAQVLARSNEELESFRGQAVSFVHGAITGEPTDMPSMLGSLSLDLFVLGDIRDIAVQGWKEATDGSGDNLILALSAIGLTTTLAPHLDWAPALLKALKRTGALTKDFVEFLSRTARKAIGTGDYGDLTKTVTEFGQAAGRLGPGPLRGVMSSVDNAADLSRVAGASAVDPRNTYVVVRLFGKNGIKAIDMNGRNVSTVAASIKAGTRLTKLVKKSAGSISSVWLGAIAIASLLVLISALLPRKGPSSAVARGRTGMTDSGTNGGKPVQTSQ